MKNDQVERFVKQYGDGYRNIIEASLDFLDENEHTWHLEVPIDRDEYISNIVSKTKPKDKSLMTQTGYSRVGLNNI